MTLYKRQLITINILMFIVLILSFSQQIISNYSSAMNDVIESSRIDIEHAIATLPDDLANIDLNNITNQSSNPLIEKIFPAHKYRKISLMYTDYTPIITVDNPIISSHSSNLINHLNSAFEHNQQHKFVINDNTIGIIAITTQSLLNNQGFRLNLFFSTLTTLILIIVSSFVIYVFCKNNFSSLNKLTLHASSVDSFNQQPLPIPKEQDISIIVRALNKLHYQLKTNFKKQADEAEKLRQQIYMDSVSGIGNRSFFLLQLESWLDESHHGGLILIQTDLISDIYQNDEYSQGDKLVKTIVSSVNQTINQRGTTFARLSQDKFAIILPDISSDKLLALGYSILKSLNDTVFEEGKFGTIDSHIGLVHNTSPSNSDQILAVLDNALTQAKIEVDESLFLAQNSNNKPALGKQQWKSLIEEAIYQNQFKFSFQSVTLSNRQNYHYEVFTSFDKNNINYSAGKFLGAVEDLKIGNIFDKHVIKSIINKLNADKSSGPFAINITNNSIKDLEFIHWLDELLENNTGLSKRLFFEIQEISCIRHTNSTSILSAIIHRHKFGIGIDNYGRHFQALSYLKKIKPNYVKIDYIYTQQLNDHTKSSLLASICRTAHSLNIKVLATRVETATQLERLSELFVDGYQGYITDKQTSPKTTKPTSFTV